MRRNLTYSTFAVGDSESAILFLDVTFTAVLTQSPTRDSQRHVGAQSKAFGALGSDGVVA